MRISATLVALASFGLLVAGCGSSKPTEPDDKLPPLITWNSPAADTLFAADTVTVQFNAADDGGTVSDVKVYVDGTLAATVTASPFRTTLDLSAIGNNRAVFIYATASDPTGKVGVTADTLKFTKALPPDTAVWTQLTGFGTEPISRYGHSMSLDPIGKRAIIFGGYNVIGTFAPRNDTWAFDFATDTWDSLATTGTSPDARYVHAGGVVNNLLVVFGGYSVTDSLMEDFGILDLTGLQWTVSLFGSRPLPSAGIATATIGGQLYLYGGSYDPGAGDPLNSGAMWSFSPADSLFSLIAATNPPGGRFMASMAPDLEGGRLFLFGGISGATSTVPPSDASYFLFDTGSEVWDSKAPSGPPPVQSAVAIYDSLNNRILVWGGKDATGTLSTALWQFSLGGGFWTKVPTTGGPPNGRTNFGMVKDPDSSRAVMFGGFISGNSNGETWELKW